MKWITCILLMAIMQQVVAKEPLKNYAATKSLLFIENNGQIADQHGTPRKDIDFRLQAQGVTIFAGSGALHYQWERPLDDSGKQIATYRMDVELVGADRQAQPVKEESQPYYENYYLPQCPDGVTAHSYRKITYRNIYPNIDWVIYSNGRELKYDFVVRKGGNAKDIRLQYNGATTLALKEGAFTAATPLGSITEAAPYTYDAATKQPIASAYKLNGNILTFDIAPHEGEIVIDPTLAWATYYGGTSDDIFYSVDADDIGNIFATGLTSSTNNIATAGAHQTTISSSFDGVLVKFNTAGVLQWGTYYGGSSADIFDDIAIDNNNNACVVGSTHTTSGLATAGAHKTSLGGNSDVLLVKFNNSGIRIWATYYGGAGNEGSYYTHSVACNNNGDIFVASTTNSDTGIATPGSFHPNIIHSTVHAPLYNYDAFLVKFSGMGVRQWSTYYGGDEQDYFTDVAVDNAGNVLVCGNTTSDTSIATSGTHLQTRSGHAFVVKFNTNGTRLWGTYYGGNNNTFAYSLAAGPNNVIYLCGVTSSTINIATPGSYMMTPASGYIAKLNSSGNRIWGTYHESHNTTYYSSITTDTIGSFYMISTVINSTISAPCNIQPPGGGYDAFFSFFDSSGTKIFSSYLGGTGPDYGLGVVYDQINKAAFIVGRTFSSGIATSGAHQTVHGNLPPIIGNGDGFIAKYFIDTSVYIKIPFTDTLLCAGDTIDVRYGTMFSYNAGNTFTIQLSNAAGSFASPVNIGTAGATGGGVITCVIPPGTPTGSGYKIRIISSSPANIPCNSMPSIGIGIAPPANLIASSSPVCTGDTIFLNGSTTTSFITSWKWKGPGNYTSAQQNPKRAAADNGMDSIYTLTAAVYGCTASDTTAIVLKALPAINATSNTPVCTGDTLRLYANANSGSTYSWAGPGSYSSSSQNPVVASATLTQTGNFIVTATWNGCSAKDTANVLIGTPPVAPVAANNGPLCAGDTLSLTSSTSTAGVQYNWSGPSGFSSSANDTIIVNTTTARSGDYVVSVYKDGCVMKDTTTVLVKPVPALLSKSSNSPVCPGLSLQLNCSYNLSGVSYSWTGPTFYTATTQNPLRTGMQISEAGNYIVNATLNGCTSVNDTINVVVSASTPKPVASANTPVCIGQPLNLSASTITGASYNWTSTTGFSAATQNPSIPAATTATAGKYYVRATVNGCVSPPDSVIVVVNPAPQVNVYPSPKDTICAGANVTFVSNTTNAGTNFQRRWYRNNNHVAGATGANYSTTTAADKDEYYITITATGLCADPYTDTSNVIRMTVLPWLAPSVSITANPNTTVPSGTMINFKATPVNGGAKPTYQWTRNGTNIGGALSDVWGASTLSNGDDICVIMTSSYLCPNPTTAKSNCIKVSIETTGINSVWKEKIPDIYPNPTKDKLIIAGVTKGVMIQLYDVLGRVVITQTADNEIVMINTAGLAPGNYVLLLSTDNGDMMRVKLVKE